MEAATITSTLLNLVQLRQQPLSLRNNRSALFRSSRGQRS